MKSGQKFGEMELLVKQWVTEQETNRVDGGWHTEISLGALGWTASGPPTKLLWLLAEGDDCECDGVGSG